MFFLRAVFGLQTVEALERCDVHSWIYQLNLEIREKREKLARRRINNASEEKRLAAFHRLIDRVEIPHTFLCISQYGLVRSSLSLGAYIHLATNRCARDDRIDFQIFIDLDEEDERRRKRLSEKKNARCSFSFHFPHISSPVV